MSTQRDRSEILAEAEELAHELLEEDLASTFDEAMSAVWEELPDLYDEYTAAPVGPSPQPFVKADREPSLGDVIVEAVRKRASQLAWTAWPHKSLEDLELETWQTTDGQVLYELYRSADSRLPISQVERHINKSAQHYDAWQILIEWAA